MEKLVSKRTNEELEHLRRNEKARDRNSSDKNDNNSYCNLIFTHSVFLKYRYGTFFSERCIEVRPYMSKKMLVETKNTQLQQMRENAARREAERELDKMWYDVMIKDLKAKAEREEQDAIKKHLNENEVVEILEKQIKGKASVEQQLL